MGGAVSSGQDNEELVDNLCYDDYITTPEVEAVFRMVDRADYMQFGDKEGCSEAYEDHAWRRGTLHLSAPCIYSRAMEALQLRPGLSFLNVGSGTGYLSTMVGLLIGPGGLNHGVELYEENVEYAYQRVADFEAHSSWYDPAKFCEPLFVLGNGLQLGAGNMQYDRIYCGAECPTEYIHIFRNLLKVGGILVVPHESQLEVIKFIEPNEWTTSVALPSVSFAPLIQPSEEEAHNVLELTAQPHTLKELCRVAILVYLTRKSYDRISALPLPANLQEYVSYSREWSLSSPPLKTLCPVDHTKQRPRKKQRSGDSEHERPSTHAGTINGMQVLFCSFNGNIFQVPLDRDAFDEEEEEKPRKGEEEKQEENRSEGEDKMEDDGGSSDVEAKSEGNSDEQKRDDLELEDTVNGTADATV